MSAPATAPERPLTHFAWLSLATAVVTFLGKLLAWWLTDSVGILSDALESLTNVAAAFIALASLAVAVRPEDDEHAFGHSKAEYFAAGMEGLLILLAAVGIGWAAITRLLHPQPILNTGVGLAVLVAAGSLNLFVARVLARVGQERNSIALRADAKHLMTDVWTTAAVVVAVLLVGWTGWDWLDPLLGLLLAGHIIATGVRLVRESLYGLMDTGLEESELAAVRAILDRQSAEGVQYHALRTRQAAAMKFMTVHLLMPGTWSIAEGHAKADRIEAELRAAVQGLVVLTHIEPAEDPASFEDVKLVRK
ncbi:MAG: cation transporter [Verrucomicrobia bacterium]|nr:cation transporter [Verrucomicrobiota bacterium]